MAAGINVDLKHKTNTMFPNITTLYFDMDGVLANFYKGAEKLGAWVKNEEGKIDLDWEPIYENGEEFWENLEWTPNGKELFSRVYDYVKSKGCEVCILSAVHYKEGIEGKKKWLSNNLPSGKKHIKAYFTKDGNDKAGYIHNVGRFADEDSVLIDDFGSNCKFFINHGGHAIKYSGNVDYVMEELKKLFEWDIHEKYLTLKTNKVMSEITNDFDSFKKNMCSTIEKDTVLNEKEYGLGDAIQHPIDFAFDKVGEFGNTLKKKLKDKYKQHKKDKFERTRYQLNRLKENEALLLEVDDGSGDEFSKNKKILLAQRNGKFYVAFPNQLKRLKEPTEEEIEAYKKGKYFLPCYKIEGQPKKNFTDEDETDYIYLNGSLEITLSNVSSKGGVDKYNKLIYEKIPSKKSFIVKSYTQKSYMEARRDIYELVGMEEISKNNNNKTYRFNYDSQEDYDKSHKAIEEAIKDDTVEQFKFSTLDNEEITIFKDNNRIYALVDEVERPALLNENGIVVAFI